MYFEPWGRMNVNEQSEWDKKKIKEEKFALIIKQKGNLQLLSGNWINTPVATHTHMHTKEREKKNDHKSLVTGRMNAKGVHTSPAHWEEESEREGDHATCDSTSEKLTAKWEKKRERENERERKRHTCAPPSLMRLHREVQRPFTSH